MMLRRRVVRASRVGLLIAGALGAFGGCHTYRDQLARSERAFTANEHERALTILRDLEPDVRRLTPAEQAQYAWLRGMSDYRIGYRSDARHWLANARAMEDAAPGTLTADAKQRATEALDELNKVVYSEGTAALARRREGGDERSGPKESGTARRSGGAVDGKKKEPPAKEAP